MANVNRYIPPNLREPLRQGGGVFMSLLDNVIGLDNGYDSAGERFGRQVRQDPVGTAKAVGGNLLDSFTGFVQDPVGTLKEGAQEFGRSYNRASQGAVAYLPEGVELRSATPAQINAANEAFLADMATLSAVVPAGRVGKSVAGAAADVDYGARTADAIGIGRSIAQGDLSLLGEVMQRGGEANSVGAAKVGRDYFQPAMVNAGRTKDPAMSTGFSNTKHKIAPYEWQTHATRVSEAAPASLIDPSKYQGQDMYFATGDRTSGGWEVTGLTDVPFRRPVMMEAGPEYMDEAGKAWASHHNVLLPKARILSKLEPDSFKLSYLPMGLQSGDFAKHQGELLAEALYSAPLPSKTVATIDDIVSKFIKKREEKKYASEVKRIERENIKRDKKGEPLLSIPEKSDVIQQAPSVSSEKFRGWLKSQPTETVQKPLLAALDKSPIKALEGMFDVGEVRFAATNPDLVNVKDYTGGYRISSPDMQQGKMGMLPSDHASYNTMFAAREGTTSETLGSNIPPSIYMRDTVLPRLKEGALKSGFNPLANDHSLLRDYLLPADQRVFMMNPNTKQLMDQQWVDETSTFRELEQTLGPNYARGYARGLIVDYLRR